MLPTVIESDSPVVARLASVLVPHRGAPARGNSRNATIASGIACASIDPTSFARAAIDASARRYCIVSIAVSSP